MGRSGRSKAKVTGHLTVFRIPPLILFLLACALYLNTVGHGFVFDDGALILQNRTVTEMRLGEVLAASSYRPVRTLTYLLNYLLGGTDPRGYHLLNILLHGLNALLLFRLLELWLGTSLSAFAGTLSFVVHPVQTAAVAYVSGRKDLLATAFLLGAVICYCRFRDSGARSWLAACLFLGALAIGSKEVALIFPAILLLVELLALGRDEQGRVTWPKAAVMRRALPVLAAGLLLAGAGVVQALVINQATRMTDFWGGSLAVNLATSFKLFAHYLRLVVWPHPLIADYSGEVLPLATGFGDPLVLLGLLLAAGFALTCLLLLARLPLISLGMAWFLISLVPVLQIVPFHELAADHFLYLPLVGVALVVGQLFALAPVSENVLARAALAIAAVAGCWGTVVRNRDWKDSLTLWEATYAVAPGSYRANANLGRFYFESSQRREEGIRLTRRALELLPGDPVAVSNYGIMQFYLAQQALARGDSGGAAELARSARQSLLEAHSARSGDGSILVNLGSAESLLGALLEVQGRGSDSLQMRRAAIERFQHALLADSRSEIRAAWYNMALVRIDLQQWAEAASDLEHFLETNPQHPDANFRLAMCRLQLGRLAEAVSPLQKVLQVQPTAMAFEFLAATQERLGNLEAALSVCRDGLQRFPDHEGLKRRLAALQSTP